MPRFYGVITAIYIHHASILQFNILFKDEKRLSKLGQMLGGQDIADLFCTIDN